MVSRANAAAVSADCGSAVLRITVTPPGQVTNHESHPAVGRDWEGALDWIARTLGSDLAASPGMLLIRAAYEAHRRTGGRMSWRRFLRDVDDVALVEPTPASVLDFEWRPGRDELDLPMADAVGRNAAALITGSVRLARRLRAARLARSLVALAVLSALARVAEDQRAVPGTAREHERTDNTDPPAQLLVLTDVVLTAAPPRLRARATQAA